MKHNSMTLCTQRAASSIFYCLDCWALNIYVMAVFTDHGANASSMI